MAEIIGPLEVGETKAVRFNFENEAGVNAALSAPSVTCTVISGTDASPSSVLSGAPIVLGLEVVQLVQPGVVGVNYKLRAFASDTATGQTHGITAHLKVVNG